MNTTEECDLATKSINRRRSLKGSLYRRQVGDHAYYTMRYRDRQTGRQREKSIGPVDAMSLAQARKRVEQLKGMLYGGEGDPIDSVRLNRLAAARERALRVTFGDYAKSYVEKAGQSWKNPKSHQQWTNSLNTHCKALLPLYLKDITSDDVVAMLRPIWSKRHVTATRVRQRVEKILDSAAAQQPPLRDKDNPARWEHNLEHREELRVKAKAKRVKHHSALPYTEIADFVAVLKDKKSISAKALLLQILTATRSNETVGARWAEFDLQAGYWEIPEDRMKSGKPHKVPLAPQVIELLQGLGRDKSGFVFPGAKARTSVCTDAMLRLAKRMRPDITCHGFRSTFRSWVADKTSYQHEIAEMALAHVTKDKVVAAYRRTTMYEKREAMMKDWANQCFGSQEIAKPQI